jgi:hypothetical protein
MFERLLPDCHRILSGNTYQKRILSGNIEASDCRKTRKSFREHISLIS